MDRKTLALALALVSTLVLAYAVNVDGTWSGELHTREGGAFQVTLTLKAQGDKLTGTYGQGAMEDVNIENGRLSGDTVTFSITRQVRDQQIKISYTGKVEGNTMKLTSQREGSQRPGPEVTLTKQK
ncbi:MAG TPA: hypothetical protein VFA60_11125 [Terriglobales bacterium]|nr:hypothetical protein [Terriglobales bacterium]